MKNFLAFATLAATSMSLIACELDGKMTAYENVQLINKKGRPFVLAANQTYKASIEKEDNSLQLEIEVNGKEQTVRIRPPAGQQVPKKNGEIFVTAAQAGQAVDVQAAIRTVENRGPTRRDIQSCTAQVQVRVCDETERVLPDGSRSYDRICRLESESVAGRQEVEYHLLKTIIDGEVRLLAPGSNNEAARFVGHREEEKKVVTWTGVCRQLGGHLRPRDFQGDISILD